VFKVKKQVFIGALTAMLLSLTIMALPNTIMNQVLAQTEPLLKIEPDFIQSYNLGEEFNVNVTIYDLEATLHLIGIHFRLTYDSELLEIVNAYEGDFLSKFNQTSTPPSALFVWSIEGGDPVYPTHIAVGDILLPDDTGNWPGPYPEGNGTVATIRFKVIYRPVEPQSMQVSVLRFIEVMLLDDLGNELPYRSAISLYQSPEPLRYPQASFTYQPTYPVAGQTVLFEASNIDPNVNGTIVEYRWNFNDGTTINTGQNVTTHMFTQPETFTVTLSVVDNFGLIGNTSKLITVGVYTPIDIKIEAGKLYYPGETAEFSILTSQLGKAVDVSFTKLQLYFNGNLYTDLLGSIQTVTTGLSQISYIVPTDAQAGVYTLLVEVEDSNITSTNIASFQISDSFNSIIDDLASIGATLASIDGTVATIDSTLGTIQTDVANINAVLTGLDGTVAVINSTLGTLVTDVANINLEVTAISGNIATIQTTLGTIQGTITSINGTVATISTNLGTVLADISAVKGATSDSGSLGTVTIILCVVLVLALIATIGAVLSVTKKLG
jgi:PKD repeat protein